LPQGVIGIGFGEPQRDRQVFLVGLLRLFEFALRQQRIADLVVRYRQIALPA
jgi:hypothetical protein